MTCHTRVLVFVCACVAPADKHSAFLLEKNNHTPEIVTSV